MYNHLPPSNSNINTSSEKILRAVREDGSKIVSIMGPNGAGKTRILRQIANSEAEWTEKPIFIGANRSIDLSYISNGIDHRLTEADPQATIKQALEALAAKSTPYRSRMNFSMREINLGNLISQVATKIHLGDRETIALYRDQLWNWDENGADIKSKPTRPVSKIHILSEKLGSIVGRPCRITIPQDDGGIVNIEFDYNGNWIDVSNLSDGERQILLIATLRLSDTKNKSVLLVDEPELHLNERLACDIWSNLEIAFEETPIIYATHSVVFSTRPGVERLFLVDMEGKLEEISTPSFPPSSAVHSIIGGRIQFLKSEKKTVYCEDALSSIIIKDLLRNYSVDISVLPGHEPVESAIKSERIWASLRTTGPKIAGITDRDAQDEDEIHGRANSGIFCLPFYDAEAIFQQPEIGLWMINISRDEDKLITIEKFTELVAECALHRMEVTIDKHAKHISRQNQSRIIFEKVGTNYQLKEIKNPANIDSQFGQRLVAIQDALSSRDIANISKLFYGKDMYKSLRSNIRRDFSIDISEKPEIKYKELRKTSGFYKQLDSIPSLCLLREKLLSYLDL